MDARKELEKEIREGIKKMAFPFVLMIAAVVLSAFAAHYHDRSMMFASIALFSGALVFGDIWKVGWWWWRLRKLPKNK